MVNNPILCNLKAKNKITPMCDFIRELPLANTIIHQKKIMSTRNFILKKYYVNLLCKLYNMWEYPLLCKPHL